MTRNRTEPPRLHVLTQERHHYIMVPRDWAGDLRIYLRGKGVFSHPPEPYDEDIVSVELDKKADTAAIQVFLDRWDK